jgi:hypothetical protein
LADPKAQIRGELMLVLNAFGAAKTVFVRRHTYPERFDACLEQRLQAEPYQTTYDVNVIVPFQIGER